MGRFCVFQFLLVYVHRPALLIALVLGFNQYISTCALKFVQIQSFGLYPVEPKNNLTFDKKFYILTRRSFSMPLTRQNFFCSSEKSTLRETEVGVSMSYYRDNSYEYLHQKWECLSNNSLMPMLFP